MAAPSAPSSGRVQGQARADVALDDKGLLLEVLFVGGLEHDFAADGQEGADVRFHALEVDAAVARHADDYDLAFAGRQGDGEDNVLQRVSGGPGAAVGLGAGHQGVGGVDERIDGGGVRGVPDLARPGRC